MSIEGKLSRDSLNIKDLTLEFPERRLAPCNLVICFFHADKSLVLKFERCLRGDGAQTSLREHLTWYHWKTAFDVPRTLNQDVIVCSSKTSARGVGFAKSRSSVPSRTWFYAFNEGIKPKHFPWAWLETYDDLLNTIRPVDLSIRVPAIPEIKRF